MKLAGKKAFEGSKYGALICKLNPERRRRMSGPLKKVTIYFTQEEYASLQAIADDEEVTLSAVVRAKLGLVYKRRGAPTGNTNRQARAKVNRLERWEKVIDAGPPPMTLLKEDERGREF